MKKMELLIKRYIYNDSKTTGGEANNIGDFFIDGVFFCYSLEDQIRFEKVYGKTAIPDGRYKVILTRSNRFKRIMPLLVDVPNFSGVRLHGGNTAENSHGCPLIAFNTDKVKIWGSAEKALTKKLQAFKAETLEGEIWLTIENKHLSYEH
jgi:hypothetical protein